MLPVIFDGLGHVRPTLDRVTLQQILSSLPIDE